MDAELHKSRKEAVSAGAKLFFSGEPCARGHVSPRYVKGPCMECERIRKRKVAAEHRSKNGPALSQKGKDYYARHKERIGVLRSNRADQVKLYNKEYNRINRARRREQRMERRATEMRARPIWFSDFDEFVIKEAHSLSILRERLTGKKWNVDHMIPLKSGACCGLHCASNVQVIPETVNHSKGNKMLLTDPLEWIFSL